MTPSRATLRSLADMFPTIPERCYTRGKLFSDPLYPAVLARLDRSSAPLLDIGCGMGVLAFYLRLGGWPHPIHGIDYDPRKIATATRLAPGFDGTLRFANGDALAGLPDHHGNVTLLDLLQYFPPPQRAELLQAAARRVSPDGMLIIRTGLRDAGWRFRITRAMDHAASLVRWMKSPPLHYPDKAELSDVLAAAGMHGEFTPLWGNTPFNNWLGVFAHTPARRADRPHV